MRRLLFNDKWIDDKGFSLVELIICIAILGIATVPLLSAFSTSGRVITKAQSMQNATSVAESVMEEIKGSSIQQLENNYTEVEDAAAPNYAEYIADTYDRLTYGTDKLEGNKSVLVKAKDTPFYVLCKKDVKSDAAPASSDGELFTVVASIDASGLYAGTVGDTTAIDANSIELPVIDRIDKGKHVVISKELNRLDSSAVETWKDNWRDKNHKDSSDPTPLSKIKKEISISINDPVTSPDEDAHKMDVECFVRYYDATKSQYDADEFRVEEKVYSGTVLGTKDSRVYVFYQTAAQAITTNNEVNGLSNPVNVIDHEDIIIKSTSDEPRDPDDPRRVYLIFQENEEHPTGDSSYYSLGAGNTTISIKADDGTNNKTVTANSSLAEDGTLTLPETGTDKTLMVITNLQNTASGGRQGFYHKEKDDYIYAVDVFVYDKNDEERVHLTSTKDAQITTPEGP